MLADEHTLTTDDGLIVNEFHCGDPARFGSTASLGNRFSYRRSTHDSARLRRAQSSRADRVVVATDDQRIEDVVRGFGGECLMTASDHLTGTDRLAEVVDVLGLAANAIIVNVQGDEPLLPASAIHQVADMLITHSEASIATLVNRSRMHLILTIQIR